VRPKATDNIAIAPPFLSRLRNECRKVLTGPAAEESQQLRIKVRELEEELARRDERPLSQRELQEKILEMEPGGKVSRVDGIIHALDLVDAVIPGISVPDDTEADALFRNYRPGNAMQEWMRAVQELARRSDATALPPSSE
jgi:hypothetical protein